MSRVGSESLADISLLLGVSEMTGLFNVVWRSKKKPKLGIREFRVEPWAQGWQAICDEEMCLDARCSI